MLDGTSKALLKHIESLGYDVTVKEARVFVVQAVSRERPVKRHVARAADATDEQEVYRAVCALAEMVGISLEG